MLLLTHEFIYTLPYLVMLFASLILGILSVTDPCFLCAQLTDDSPSLNYCGRLVLADAKFFTGGDV